MTYISGTVNDPNPAAALYTAMVPALTAAGYTLADTVVIGTRTHKVWTSPAAANAEGKDWYLDIAYTTTGTGSVWFGAFETYDVATHTAGLGPYREGSYTVDAVEFSRYGTAKYPLETNWGHVSGNLSTLTCSGTSLGYWISVTPDRVIGLTSAAPGKVAYCGLFEPYAPWKAKCGAVAPGKFHPLVTATLVTPSANDVVAMGVAALTRVPPSVAVGGGSGWYDVPAVRSSSSSGSSSSSSGSSGVGGPSGYIDTGVSPYLDGPPQGDRVQLAIARGSLPDRGHGAGWLYDVARWGTSTATATSRGDTTTVDGAPWVLATAVGHACFGFKAV